MQSICRVFNCIHNSSLLHAFQFTSWNFHSNAQQIHKISQEISIIVFFRLSSGPSSANPSSTDLPLDSVNCRAVRPTAPWNWCPGGLSMALPPQKPSQLPSKPIHIRKQKKEKDRISPQVYVSLHPHVGIYEKFFKKVHCFEFRAGASSADWSWIKGATCPNQIFRRYHHFWQNMLSTSGLNSSESEDLEDLEYQMRLGRGNMRSHKGCMMHA